MKIVKQFFDYEFFKKNYYLAFEETDDQFINGFWLWGLGEDGELYCRCSDFVTENWYLWDKVGTFKISLKEMKKIIKEFGHLIVFT